MQITALQRTRKARWYSDNREVAESDEVNDNENSTHLHDDIGTSIKEQGPDDAKVKSAKFVPSDVVQEVWVLSETLAELRIGQVAQLLEELAIEARRRRGARPARAPRAWARTALRRDALDPRPSAPPASRLLHAGDHSLAPIDFLPVFHLITYDS